MIDWFREFESSWMPDPLADKFPFAPALKREWRYIGPKWVAYLLVVAHGKKINPIIAKVFAIIAILSKARYETRELK